MCITMQMIAAILVISIVMHIGPLRRIDRNDGGGPFSTAHLDERQAAAVKECQQLQR